MFSLTTLLDNEYMKGKSRTVSQVSQLLHAQEKLGSEMEEFRIKFVAKDVEIVHPNNKNQKLSSERQGVIKELVQKYAKF